LKTPDGAHNGDVSSVKWYIRVELTPRGLVCTPTDTGRERARDAIIGHVMKTPRDHRPTPVKLAAAVRFDVCGAA